MYEYGGRGMGFERVAQMVKETPTSVLCDVWGASPEYVQLCRMAPHHMTVHEVGELAAANGMKLPDILAV